MVDAWKDDGFVTCVEDNFNSFKRCSSEGKVLRERKGGMQNVFLQNSNCHLHEGSRETNKAHSRVGLVLLSLAHGREALVRFLLKNMTSNFFSKIKSEMKTLSASGQARRTGLCIVDSDEFNNGRRKESLVVNLRQKESDWRGLKAEAGGDPGVAGNGSEEDGPSGGAAAAAAAEGEDSYVFMVWPSCSGDARDRPGGGEENIALSTMYGGRDDTD